MFGKAEAADHLAGRQLGQVFAPLLFGAVGVYGVHHQRALYAGEAAKAGVYAFELVHDQAIGHVVHARRAVFDRQIGAEVAHLAEFWHEMLGEFAALPVIGDVGRRFGVQKVARGGLYLTLFVAHHIHNVVVVEHGRVLCVGLG